MAHMEFHDGVKAHGYEQFALSTTQARGFNLELAGASSKVVVQCQGSTARMRYDGADPTRTTGYMIGAGETVSFSGALDQVRFIGDGGSAPVLSVHYF